MAASNTLRITNTGAGSITYKIAIFGTSRLTAGNAEVVRQDVSKESRKPGEDPF